MYFKDTNNQLHVIDESFTHLLPQGCIEITQEEADAIHIEKNPPPDPQIQINADALAYLASTDWYVVRFSETGVAIPQDVLDARQAARDSIV